MSKDNDLKEEALFPCLLVLAKAGIVVEKKIEKMNLLTNSVLELTDGYKKICVEHLSFLNNQLQPVVECEDEYVKKRSSLLSFQDFLNKRQIQEEHFNQTAQQRQPLNNFGLQQTHEQNKLFSEKSVDTLSQQLSQIKIDKNQDVSMQHQMEQEIDCLDPVKELSQVESKNLDRYYFQQKQNYQKEYQIIIEKEQTKLDSNQWFLDADVQYEPSSINSNNNSSDQHDYSWRDADDSLDEKQSLLKEIPFQIFNECSIMNNGTMNNDNELLLNHFTPKKKRLFCNNKKIPTWAQDIQIVKSNWQKQKQDPCQLFGVLSERALKQAIELSQSQMIANSKKWKHQHQNLTSSINEVDSQRKINLEKLKKHQQEASQKFDDYVKCQRFKKGNQNLFMRKNEELQKM